jgi:hypothetical protein
VLAWRALLVFSKSDKIQTAASSTTPSADDYLVELLSEHGKRRATIGWAAISMLPTNATTTR